MRIDEIIQEVQGSGSAPNMYRQVGETLQQPHTTLAEALPTLHILLERLQLAEEQIDRKEAELAAVRTALDAERQCYQQLEQRLIEHTGQLKAANIHKEALLVRERMARARAEEIRRRQAFLAEASRILALSIDYEDTL